MSEIGLVLSQTKIGDATSQPRWSRRWADAPAARGTGTVTHGISGWQYMSAATWTSQVCRRVSRCIGAALLPYGCMAREA